jgi:hypothetical protein
MPFRRSGNSQIARESLLGERTEMKRDEKIQSYIQRRKGKQDHEEKAHAKVATAGFLDEIGSSED